VFSGCGDFFIGLHQISVAGCNGRMENESKSLAYESYGHTNDLPADVKELFALAEQESIEFGADWFANLIDAVYAKDKGIAICVLRLCGKPVAALPIRVIHQTFGVRVESLSNYYTALYSPVFDNSLQVAELSFLLKAIQKQFGQVSSWRFSPMAPESSSYRLLLKSLLAIGNSGFEFFSFGNWFLKVNEDWNSYLKGRTGALRSNIKRMSKKFSAEGGLLSVVKGGPSLDDALSAYQNVYAKSWKKPEPFVDFVPGLIRTCSNRGWLRLGIASIHGRPIAAQIWIVANKKALIYKVAYDEEFKANAPGTLVSALLMEHTFSEDKVTEVDYLIGDDPYKKTWMSDRRERWGIIAYNPFSVFGLFGLIKELFGRACRGFAGKFFADKKPTDSLSFPRVKS
jgi:Acetyltransferase (GNAT) domain